MEISNDTETKKIVVTDKMKADFLTSCKWIRFLIVFNLIGYIIFVLYLLEIAHQFAFDYTDGDGLSTSTLSILTVYVIIIFAIGLYPLFKFWKFASFTRAAIRNTDNVEFDKAILYAKQAVKFVGVLSICVGVLLIVIILYCLEGTFGIGLEWFFQKVSDVWNFIIHRLVR